MKWTACCGVVSLGQKEAARQDYGYLSMLRVNRRQLVRARQDAFQKNAHHLIVRDLPRLAPATSSHVRSAEVLDDWVDE